jgi:L-lysine exporter family protein LysE/ArgO
MLPGVIGSFLAGLGLQASLIAAFGPQNAFVLRQGLRREHVLPVVVLCTAADVLLLAAGAGGVSAVAAARPWAQALLRWGGAAAMGTYGVRALLRALRPGALAPSGAGLGTRRVVLLQAASFTFLNPHVYVDTLLLLGAVAASQPPGGAPWFVAGASAASATWFAGLGLAAHLLAPALGRPAAWRLIDAATGVVMCALAICLA